jgi:cytochrome c-type biogenesis protein
MGAGIDTTVFAAFAAGFVSFISPCVLPLVPGYLSAVSGVSVVELQEGDRRATARVLGPAIVFCLSFTAVFVALGMVATGLGSTLRDNRDLLNHIAGGLIIVMGLVFIGSLFVPRLNAEWRPHALIARAGSGGPLVAGAAFAIGWTPCIGPTLTAILNAAAVKDTVAQGAILLAIYSAGLAIPFLLSAVAFQRATRVFRWLRDHYTVITAVSGATLILMGVLIFTGELTRLNTEAQQFLQSLGLDGLYNL